MTSSAEVLSSSPLQPKLLGSEHIPEEWLNELQGLPPKSYERKVMLETMGALAAESGIKVGLDTIDAPTLAETYPGFTLVEPIKDYEAEVETSELTGKVRFLAVDESRLRAPVVEATTDNGNKIRVIDLRESMTASVRKLGAGLADDERRRLEEVFWRDVKYLADMGKNHNVTINDQSIGYSKVPDTKLRTYFTPLEI